MRTTLTLDADVHSALQQIAKREGKTFQRALNDTLRAGVAASDEAVPAFRQPVFALGRSRIDLTKALSRGDELDVQTQIAKFRARS
jgi:acyl-CoA thioesterase FadM